MGSSNERNPRLYKDRRNAVAAYLKLSQFELVKVDWDETGCQWCFIDSADLRTAIAIYDEGSALVDPKEYNRVFLEVRSEMFATDPRSTEERRRVRGLRHV